MIKTYLKLAFRSLLKNRVFSFINVFSLTIGLTCCWLISLYVYQELSYDAHQQHADRLYQVGLTFAERGEKERSAHTPAPMAPAMQQEFPEIAGVTRLASLFEDDKTLFQFSTDQGEVKSFYETRGYLADSNFFQLFSYKFKAGNPATALANPNSVVISEEIAQKLFGSEPAINKVIHINSNTNGAYNFKITGVFIPAPTPSHLDARFLLSMQGGAMGNWMRTQTDMVNNNMWYTYLLLKPGADARQLESKFPAFIEKYAGADLKATGSWRTPYLTPVRDIHLYANDSDNVTESGSLGYLYILVSIALVTLLIACVNFMNLSTARSSKRAVEIGVRKVLGAERKALVGQFLWEAILLSVIAFVFSIALARLLLPLFQEVAGKEFSFSPAEYLYLALGYLGITLVAGFISGVYPAFYLSAFKPLKVLKGNFTNSLAAVSLRKVLVVFQFVISVSLIFASLTIRNQMNFMQTKDLGFQKSQQIVIPLRTTTAKSIYPALKSEFSQNQAIAQAGASIFYPGITNTTDWLLYKEGNTPDNHQTVFMNRVDQNFLQTLKIKPVAGRLFSKDFPADTNNRIILNEQAIRKFEFSSAADAIGKNLMADRGPEKVRYTIVGVVKDFHFKDLHTSIESYGFLLNRWQDYNYLVANVKNSDIKTALAGMAATWSKLNPNEPFEYSFLDQDFSKNYSSEARLAAIIQYFTLVAIFISCLGLFGLTTFSVEQRTKEIGIRKVLGASTAGIVSLLSKDFLKLVSLSLLIAFPLAWYFLNNWLQNFAYRAPFTVWLVITASALALLIAFLTISIQAIKVALSNPVGNLRSE